MIPKAFDDIQKADIDSLVTSKTVERRTLDYKELLPGNSDEEKREFLYDISSFANAAGGDLIFGISDQRDSGGKPTGIPESANGLAGISNTSAEIARLEAILQSSIAPRIPGIRFRDFPGFKAGPVLIVRVPKSWVAPHMITYKGTTRFYSRNSTGKYPLDVFEIRSAFALSESLPERLAKFRDGRLSAIVANEAAIPLPDAGKVILHSVPLAALHPTFRLELSPLQNTLRMLLRPMATKNWDTRFNFDGFLSYSPNNNYVQLFRSGAIEAIEVNLLDLKEWRKLTRFTDPDFIAFTDFEDRLINDVSSYTQLQKRIAIGPPVFIMISFLGVKGFRVTTGPASFGGHTIDRDALILPDVVMNDFVDAPSATQQAGSLLKPVFDALAQAGGLPGSPSYDSNGNRKKKP